MRAHVPLAIALLLHGAALFASAFVTATRSEPVDPGEAGYEDEPTFVLDLRESLKVVEPPPPEPEPEPPLLELASAPEAPLAEEPAELELPEVEPEPVPEPVAVPALAEPEPVAAPEPVLPPEPAPQPATPDPAPGVGDSGPVVASAPVEPRPPAAGAEGGGPPTAGAPAPERPPASAAGAGRTSGAGTSPAGSGEVEAGALRVRRAPKPEYPEGARRRKEEGSVTCRLTIDREGLVVEVQVLESSGFRELDQAAVRTLERWRFEPLARLTGSERAYGIQRLTFELTKRRRP